MPTRGRPNKPEKRSKALTVTITPTEYQALQGEARDRRMTIANVIRERLGISLSCYTTPPNH